MTSILHARHQAANLAALGRLGRLLLRPPSSPAPSAPIVVEAPPPAPGLVADYVRWCGGDPKAWRGRLPPHLFCHWAFAPLARSLEQVPYPLGRVLNQGCRVVRRGPLPADRPLRIVVTIESVEESGGKARIHQRVTTAAGGDAPAVEADVYVVVPLSKPEGGGKKRERARVPAGWRPLAELRLGPRAGLQFSLLTGDFNPVHWLPPYARAAGFRSTILHGFAQLARASETLTTRRFGGDTDRLRSIDVRFVRPLLLPARPRVLIGPDAHGPGVHGLAVGDSAEGPAYMIGRFETGDPPPETP